MENIKYPNELSYLNKEIIYSLRNSYLHIGNLNIENLKNMNVVNNHDIYNQSTYSGSELCNALNEVFVLDLNKEYY